MFKIQYSDAIELDHQVRRLIRCVWAGVTGFADADNLGSYPMDAAVMVISNIHAKGLQSSETLYTIVSFGYYSGVWKSVKSTSGTLV